MTKIHAKDAAINGSVFTSTILAATAANPIVPEFIRIPKPGHLCLWTGLSRSKMIELITPSAANDWNPHVKSVSLRQKGRGRGCRLVVYSSLITYLKSNLNETN